jgi:hypothetical protein
MTVTEPNDGSTNNALERLAQAEQYIVQLQQARIDERLAVERVLGILDGELRVPGTTLADVVRERETVRAFERWCGPNGQRLCILIVE